MESILDALAHRGPDARGVLPLPEHRGVLGHTRLSIIDLDSRSNQPFTSRDGRFALVYNGEIYNYRELRQTLLKAGVSLHTESDTEVLLLWLIRNGKEGLHDLDGMFAFALLDREAGELLLARDRLGEKPLYYVSTRTPRGFAFSSEMRGLVDLPGVDRTLDEEALRDYLRFLYTPAPLTLYKGIRELPPGHLMEVDLLDWKTSVDCYYDLEQEVHRRAQFNQPPYYRAFGQVFDECLGRRLEADVPVCVYFSGGVDSSLIVSSIRKRKAAPNVETFTIRYHGSQQAAVSDESQPARRLAEEWGIPNKVVDFSAQLPFLESVERVVDLFEHPFGNSTALVSDILAKEVSREYKVVLAGDGGDELSGGYPRHNALLAKQYTGWLGALVGTVGTISLHLSSMLPSLLPFGRRARAFGQGANLPPEQAYVRWASYLSGDEVALATGSNQTSTRFQEHLYAIFRRNMDDLLQAASLVDLYSFVPYNLLRSADRTGMANSLEVRVPFLAPEVVEKSLSLPQEARHSWKNSKRLFREAFGNRLPDWVWDRRKMPFNPPIHDYLRQHLTRLNEFLCGDGARVQEVIHRDFVEGQISHFRHKRRENSTLLWGLATLEAWLRRR